MKKLSLLIASLALVGAGCGAQTTVQTPPPDVTPSGTQPAVPAEPGETPAEPAVPGTTGTEVEASLTASISILASGEFSPQTVTIKKGGKVTWTNTGTAKVWPASDPHPTHGGYVGFDSKGELAPTETWSFTFEKAGTWGYHDHLHPLIKGTVIVTE